MNKKPIDELLNSSNIYLYLIGRKMLNLKINISEEDVEEVKNLSKNKELDDIVEIMLKKYRNYTDSDLRKCQIPVYNL